MNHIVSGDYDLSSFVGTAGRYRPHCYSRLRHGRWIHYFHQAWNGLHFVSLSQPYPVQSSTNKRVATSQCHLPFLHLQLCNCIRIANVPRRR